MRKRVIRVMAIVGIGFASMASYGQTTLNDLVSYTLANSHEVKKLQFQQKEADYLRRETIGKGLPQAKLDATYSKMYMNIDIPSETVDKLNQMLQAPQLSAIAPMVSGMLPMIDAISGLNMLSGGVQVTQLIYSQSYLVGLKATKNMQELYAILREKTDEDLIADVATGYYQAGSLILQLQSLDKSLKNLKEIHRIVELSYENDLVKETQVNRLKVTISNLEVTRQTIDNGIKSQLNYLKALAGMPADSSLSIDTARLINDFVAKEVTGFKVENVPAYRVLEKQDEIYSRQVKSAQATYFPTLAAFGKLSYSSYGLFFKGDNADSYKDSQLGKMSDLSHNTTVGLNLSLPLFTSGSNYYKVKQAKVKQAQLREDMMKTSDLLTVNFNNASMEFQSAKAMVDAQKENRDLALKVYTQTSLLFQEGMTSMAELLNVNSDFLQADNTYNQQILKCKTAEIKMLKASGNMKSIVKN